MITPTALFGRVSNSTIAGYSACVVLLASLLMGSGRAMVTDYLGRAWMLMESRLSLFQMCVYGSAAVHMAATACLQILPLCVQNMPALQQYKIQQNKQPASKREWSKVAGFVLASHLLVQLPLITGQYYFVEFMGIPYKWEHVPSLWSLTWRVVVALWVEDAWHYFGHRFLHGKKIYRYIHKLHHTWPNPFALEAEFAHPLETVFLGTGFFIACVLLTNHLIFMWWWLVIRLLETTDVHMGYDLPFTWNPLTFLPFYAGVRFHDFHHAAFNVNYASTFLVWDNLLGTATLYNKHERKRRDQIALLAVAQMSAKHKEPQSTAAPSFAYPRSVAITGSEGMVGRCTVAALVEEGGTRVVCLDRLPQPADFNARKKAAAKRGCELVYVQADITDRKAMLGKVADEIRGCECLIHVAALVGPFFPHAAYDRVNYQGTLNVIDAARAGGVAAMVDCTSPSTRFDGHHIRGESEQEVWDNIGGHYKGIHEYAATKARGEEAVLGAAGMSTCAVAPHQVYGPSDTLFLPAMLATAKAGALRVMGDGKNLVSFTHESNIAHALLLAAGAMAKHAAWVKGGQQASDQAGVASARVTGEYFVVTDGERGCAINLWDAIDDAVVAGGLPSIREGWRLLTSLPYYFLLPIAGLGSVVTSLTGSFVKLTPFTLRMLVIDRYFDTKKARDLLGYRPKIDFYDDDGWKAAVKAAWKKVNAKQ